MKRREQEAKDGEMRRRLAENNILVGHNTSAIRVDAKRRARSEAAERRELFMDYQHVTAEQDKARRTQIADLEEHLAQELARRKAENHRNEMERRRICDGSEELRALKERLHMAKVNKERAQQLLEINVRGEQERLREMHIAEHMENERLSQIELEHKLNIEKNKQRERVKVINQQQIAMKEAQRDEAMQEYMREKAEVEELVGKIAAEDEQEVQARWEKQQETKAALKQFMIDQKMKQEAMEEEEREEFRRIEQYAADKRAREERLAAEKEGVENEKKRILNAMLGQMNEKNKRAEEMEHLRNELHFEELEAASRQRHEMQIRKKLEDKEEMKNAYVDQMRAKEERLAKQREEEDLIRQQLMKKFAEDDRIEQMNEQRRRMRVEAHKKEAQRLIELRREMYEQQREAERAEHNRLREEEGKRQVIIEEERRRLIKEHAAALRDFLPKGTLESAEDYALMFPRAASA
eukprot:CAMPEP_0206476006 /NCGR_PEP_ID=MMETSP0324_2-20121206/34440_1 /ASSEMBLY_ACC=CAM_ASM_000836 /TAXON_ID=2866 /ORGANISM="Crypthecodinium cohnii, Strain Seligo" /LENGTH=466 /DNA_ID=CAMNT_0053951517 /DNA_START=78 /DNA_END=1478 /DNA_ORIENTATION=-